MPRRAAMACLCALLGTCRTEPATQIVVVIDTDIPSSAMDGFATRVFDRDGNLVLERELVRGSGEGEVALPGDYAVGPKGGDARRTIRVEVDARSGGRTLFQTHAITAFRRRRTLRLDMFLARRCLEEAQRCAPDERCTERGCVPAEVPAGELDRFDPDEPLRGRACGGIAIPRGSGGPSGGAIDTWENVTPAGIQPEEDFGIQDVLVDPARPSDLYAFVSLQGVWRSTDYGRTWTKQNSGENGSLIDSGQPWSAGIDPDRCRDPATPPTLYTLVGNNNLGGLWRSADGGVSWVRLALPDDPALDNPQDAASIGVDPYDGRHLIVGFHAATGLIESIDGGESWRSVALAPEMQDGTDWYGFFLDTGAPGTTRSTWLLVPHGASEEGTWRTVDAGASWQRVESVSHPLGNSQILQKDGVVYLAGFGGQGRSHGVYRSTDLGESWTHVGNDAAKSIVYGTAEHVYAQYAWGCHQCQLVEQEALSERASAEGTDWETWPVPVDNGPKGAAVTFDGVHHVVVSGNWNAGIWRYVEP